MYSEVVFAVEKYQDFIPEGRLLYPLHWEELATYKDIPLSVDDDFYIRMADAGCLVVYTARKYGELVGYAIFVARKGHPHYSKHSWAISDIIWVRPEYRDGRIGPDFVDFWDEHLKSYGVAVVHIGTKISHPAFGYVLRKKGYKATDKHYEKRLN